jgi:uncharacterized membrane protein YjgN (DUF898 family)
MAIAAHTLTEVQPRHDRLSFTGLYSPWAKVRRLQHVYRHTRLAGSSFDVHGDPIAILRGRLVGAVLFGGYALSGLVSPRAALVLLLLVGGLMPWLLTKSFRFRCHNTSHRGVRFGFGGTVPGAYKVFLGLPLLAVHEVPPTIAKCSRSSHTRSPTWNSGTA